MTELFDRFDQDLVNIENVDCTIVNSFKTLALVSDTPFKETNRQSSYPPFFSNVMFIGSSDKNLININNSDDFCDVYISFGVNPLEAFNFNIENPLEIIECINDIKNYSDDRNFITKSCIKMLDVEISIKVKECDMDEDFNNAKRWNALNKLDLDEIKSLGLLNEYLHLKLRFDDGDEKKIDYY